MHTDTTLLAVDPIPRAGIELPPSWLSPGTTTPNAEPDAVFDNAVIGGKFTIFTLLYGDFYEMHHKHLEGLLATLPVGRAEVRVGSNAVGPRTEAYLEGLAASNRIACRYANVTNDRKYPVMRRMFHDPRRPITTPYLLWFDDDTLFDADPLWLSKFAEVIVAGHKDGARLYGPRYLWTLSPTQQAWMQAAPWYRGRAFRDAQGRECSNGVKVVFASGSCWALAADVVRDQDIPDLRLGHNGGDWTIGEQVWQGGWNMQAFSNNKQIVRWSAHPRRGITEPFPGA